MSNGSCEHTFLSLPKLGIAQLRLGGDAGPAVLQATRQAVASGPGEIVSRGGCREPDQAGSTCQAPDSSNRPARGREALPPASRPPRFRDPHVAGVSTRTS